jgi:UPF0755 protein
MRKFIFLGVLFFGIYLFGRIFLVWDRPNSKIATQVSVEIVPGSSLAKISRELYRQELIADELVFKFYVKWHKLGNKLQAGSYIIGKNLTFAEIVEILQHGKSAEMKVTIPEGATIAQIDEILAKKSLIEAGTFKECASFCDLGFKISNLEGYLYPETYFVNPKKFSSKKFIQRLYNTFSEKIKPFRDDIRASGRSLNEIVIVASMIERETNHDSEMPIVADIIWKRLDEKIYLGIDATTRYAKNDWKNPLYAADFEINSPYNMRKNLGLPPTAISNPSLEAIKAAIFPENSDFYYYLHDKQGIIHYGKTLQEHNINKQKYLY